MNIRAIIVDDEPLARELIRDLLSKDDEIEIVAECGNGREALRSVRDLRPDVSHRDGGDANGGADCQRASVPPLALERNGLRRTVARQ